MRETDHLCAERPLKFILFPLGWLLAHVGRLVEIAKVLRSRGHEVVFAGEDPVHPRSRMGMAAEAGFRVVHAHEPDHPYAWDRFVRYGWLMTAWDLFRHRQWAPLDAILEGQVELIRRECPDMVVGDGTISVSTAAYITGIPAAGVMNAYATRFVATTSVFKPIIYVWDALSLAPQRRRVYRKYGCRPVNALRLFKSIPLISPDLPEFYPVPSNFPNCHMVGPIRAEPPGPEPQWFGELQDGRTNVYITMGSTGLLDAFLRRTFEALGRLPYRFVVTTAGQVREDALALAPPNFRIVKYASGSQLLDRCKALVFHGGNGTMYQALAAGVPMIALPSHLEQEICADLAVRYGFGLKLSPRRVQSAQLVHALERILREPQFRENAQRYASRVRAADGAQAAADVIEQTARAGLPAGAQLTKRP